MKKFMIWYLILNTMFAFAGSLPTRPPAKEISIRTNNLSVILNGALTTSNTVQEVIDWVDDNWHTNINKNTQYTSIGVFTNEVNRLDNKINTFSNWTGNSINTLSNYVNAAIGVSATNIENEIGSLINSTSIRLDSSFIYGLYPIYVSGSAYKIKSGVCVSKTNYVYLSSDSANISFVSPPTTNYYYSYVYINAAASTFPTNLVFTNSYTAPTYNSTYRGWYNGENRCIGVLPLMSGTIYKFYCDALGEWYNGMSYDLKTDTQDPNGYWQDTPATDSIYMPTNITFLRISMENPGGNDDGVILCVSMAGLALTQAEGGSQYDFQNALWEMEVCDTGGEVQTAPAHITAIIPVLPSRAIRWFGEDNDSNSCETYIRGYKVWR